MADRLTLLGVRGSIPAADAARFGKYGCGTICVLVHMAGETILLDAGSGLLDAGAALGDKCTLLLSHPHADHLLGLPACPALFDPAFRADIWAAVREGRGPMEQAAALMGPPLWPIGPTAFRAALQWRALGREPLRIGRVVMEHVPGNHPGGVTLFRLCAEGRSVVYMSDCELDAPTRSALVPFARDCDVLLCDAQYTDEEYAQRVGWGHSSVSMALAFSADCGAKRTVLVHHAPFRTDAALDALEQTVRTDRPDCRFGRQGECFLL